MNSEISHRGKAVDASLFTARDTGDGHCRPASEKKSADRVQGDRKNVLAEKSGLYI